MAEGRLRNDMLFRIVVAVAAIVAILFVAKIGYDRYTEKYAVERRDDGAAVTRVVRATFSRASALKVGSLSGTVQSSASDTRGFGMLTSDKVIKAPFAVDYFVDVSRLGGDDYRWDPARRRLTIDAPAVTVGRVNVDEAARTVNRTRGLFVTRSAADELAQRVSRNAQASAQAEAEKPERVAAARENARRALAALVGAPLAAAGLDDVTVAVTFPDERRGPAERWDTSRAPEEVLGGDRRP